MLKRSSPSGEVLQPRRLCWESSTKVMMIMCQGTCDMGHQCLKNTRFRRMLKRRSGWYMDTNLRPYPCIHLSIYLCSHHFIQQPSVKHSDIHPYVHWLTQSFILPCIHSLICSLMYSVTHPLIHLCTQLFFHSVIYPFIQPVSQNAFAHLNNHTQELANQWRRIFI